MSTKWI